MKKSTETVMFDRLANIKLPVRTKTYTPVPHQELVLQLKDKASHFLSRSPSEENYVTAKEGKQMFGTMTFGSGVSDLDFAIGFRNSYDKSMQVGICFGGHVIVCSNMMFAGDIITFRKHTGNVSSDLSMLIDEALQESTGAFGKVNAEVIQLKNEKLEEPFAASLLGQMFITEEILNTPELNVAKTEWLNREKYPNRNAWELYNSCTEALKNTHPFGAMEKYLKLHDFFISRLN